MIGLRREVGGDWWNYLHIFNDIKQMGIASALGRTEPGYALANWIATQFEWGIWFPNTVCALIFTIGLTCFCSIQPNPLLALAIAVPYLIIGVGMGYTRQSAAIGFEMLALISFYRGNTVRMLLFVVFATMFHSSALIVAPILGFATVRRGIGTIAVLGLLAILLYVQFRTRFEAHFEAYTSGRYVAAGAVPRLGMNLLPALVFLSFRRRFAATAGELRLWTIMAAGACLSMLMLFLTSASVILDRVGLYLIPIQIHVWSRLPNLLGKKSGASQVITIGVLAYSLTVQIVWLTYGTWGHAWLPYRNYVWDFGVAHSPPRWFRRLR